MFSALILANIDAPQFHSKTPVALHTLCGEPMYTFVRRACLEAGAEAVAVLSSEAEAGLSEAEAEAWISAQPHRVLVLPANLPLITVNEILYLAEHASERVVTLSQERDDCFFVTDRKTLEEAEEQLRRRMVIKHQSNGVTIRMPATVTIGPEVVIGQDTVIEGGCTLLGSTAIGEDCVIGAFTRLVDTTVGNRVQIRQSVLEKAEIGADTTVGPFAYLRPGSVIGEHARIGDFVEIKNAVIGKGTKVSHLTYVGDSDVGEGVNFGCGTVTANYDGRKKHRTVIGDGAFIGCNTNLIAPVKIGDGAMTAAGSTITDEVPDGAMAIARERQTNKLKRSPFGADQICTRKQEEEK